jgi:hypothetical protein
VNDGMSDSIAGRVRHDVRRPPTCDSSPLFLRHVAVGVGGLKPRMNTNRLAATWWRRPPRGGVFHPRHPCPSVLP